MAIVPASASNQRLGAPYGKTVGLAILAYKAPGTTRASIENHLAHGLYDLFDQVTVCFQACSEEDLAMAKACGVQAVGRPENLGIQGGFRWAWETLKTDYVLILENDIPVCVSPEVMRAQLREAMARLEAGEVDLVRLRNRFNPGEQNRFAGPYSEFWPVREKDPRWADTECLSAAPAWRKALRRCLRPLKAQRWCGRSPYIERYPERLFPRWIKRIGPDFLCVDSWVLPWTNQCTLISHARFGKLLDYADAHPSRNIHNSEGNKLPTLETPLNRLWWRRQHLRIGLPEGVFTHRRLDRGREGTPRKVNIPAAHAYERWIAGGVVAVGASLALCACLPMPAGALAMGMIGVAVLGFSGRVAWWRPRTPAKVPIVLMLHTVNKQVIDPICPNNTIRPEELCQLLAALRKAGYTFQTLSEAVDKPVRRSVVFTFDDGYADNYTELFPILQAFKAKATCFITNRGESDSAFLTPAQIREMAASGLVEFGGHTVHHQRLDEVPLEVAEREIRENRAWLTQLLGAAPRAFAYPCGGYTEQVVETVARAGYTLAATMHKKLRPLAKAPLLINRRIVPRGLHPWQAYLLVTRGRFHP
ncbi:MAG: polysaccharide deacetylase family protein [Candidatus Spyradenecus sp.]